MADGEKVCVICGEDCSNRPRIKDKQGRYMCKACVDRKRAEAKGGQVQGGTGAAAGAARGGAGGEGAEEDVLAFLVEEAVSKQGEPCPSCGEIMARGARICTRCGYNAETGRAIKTHVKTLGKAKQSKAKRSKRRKER